MKNSNDLWISEVNSEIQKQGLKSQKFGKGNNMVKTHAEVLSYIKSEVSTPRLRS